MSFDSTAAKMQFDTGSSKRPIKVEDGFESYTGGTNLQYYKLPPHQSISLAEFEELALERLKGERYYTKLVILLKEKDDFFSVSNAIDE